MAQSPIPFLGPLTIEVDGLTNVSSASFALPSGTVTFLLTDVAGSTLAWQAHPESMPGVIARHYELLDDAIARHGGVRPVEQGEGDSVVGAFSRASDALAAALDAQRGIREEAWPDGIRLMVRMAVHTGEAVQRDQRNYVGTAIIRAARIRSAGHGGQILVSDAAAAVAADRLPAGATLVDLGAHRLKDLARPERIWALSHPDLPPINDALRSLDAYRHNLPVQSTPLVGRREELTAIGDELDRERLLTLTGAGGVGKTRLAAQLGAELIERFPGGVWWLELAPVTDADAIAPALLSAIGLTEDGMRPAVAVAVVHLAQLDATLVVFDNCEHLIAPVVSLIDTLRAGCPNLTIVATSREPLGLPGEITWRVPSLTVPPPDAPSDIASLTQYESVRLFLERARRARPQLNLTDAQAAAVAEICHRLDGIPLALELAAARCRQLSPERIAYELNDRFRLLTGGARTLLPRQQTLQASVEWSHDLLSDDERIVLRRLAVFAGPFRYDAAEAVASAPGDLDRWAVLDLLSRLVDKSLVQLEQPDAEHESGFAEPLYRLLETVRQFALELARRNGELPAMRDAHADWWIGELDRLDARQPSNEVLSLCDRHTPDLRAALDWLETDTARRYQLLALVALAWSWTGRNDDLLAYADRWLIDGPPEDDESGWALAFAACSWALYCTRYRVVKRYQQRVYDLVEASGDGRAAMAMFGILLTRDDAKGDRAQRAFVMATDTGAHSLLCAYGPLLLYFIDAHQPDFSADARQILFDALEHATSPHQIWLPFVAYVHDHANVTGLQSLMPDPRPWDPSRRSYLLDRLLYAAFTPIKAIRANDASCASDAADYLAAFHHLAAPERWRAGAEAISVTLDGGSLTDTQAEVLRFYAHDGPHTARLCCARVLTAQGHWQKAEELLDELHHPTVAPTRFSYALGKAALALHASEVNAAAKHLGTALSLAADYPWPEYQVDLLELLSVVASLHGEHERAGRLVGSAEAIRDAVGTHYRFSDQAAWIDAGRAASDAATGTATWEAAVAEGRGLTGAEALAYATRARGERRRPKAGWDSLTPTETQVVALVAEGLTNQQIAERLLMGHATVKTHVSHALGKLGLSTRTELAAAAGRHEERRSGSE